MRFLRRITGPVDIENPLELQSRAYLDQYQVDFDPLPPLSVRLKESYQRCMQSLIFPLHVRKSIFAIFLNIICAVYQTVDAYRLLFPGSKVAANIYSNGSTHKAWDVFFWLIALATTAVNIWVIDTWAVWVYNGLRLERLARYILRFDCCITTVWLFIVYIILPVLVLSPMWLVFTYRLIWKDVAWNHQCRGWDYTILLDPVDWDNFLLNRSFVGMATILGSHSNFEMQLLRNIETQDCLQLQPSRKSHLNISPLLDRI